MQHALRVHLQPRLNGSAVGDAGDSDAGDGYLFPGLRDTQELSTLRAAERPPRHYLVAFGELIIGAPRELGDNADEGGGVAKWEEMVLATDRDGSVFGTIVAR